jgi:DNA-binding LytR/AlgR family response regulator
VIRGAQRLNALVVDDEAPARDELAFLLRGMPEIASVDEAAEAAECLSTLERGGIHVVFLDVRMPHLNGLDLARILKRLAAPPLVVFVTAFEEYAVEAFGLAAIDYLLKPVRPERLHVTIQRVLQARAARTTSPTADPPAEGADDGILDDRLALVAGSRIVLVDVDEIRLAAVEHEHVSVRTPQQTLVARQSMNELEERLRGHGFMRVHRKYLVNLHHILTIEPFFGGTYLLKVRDVPDFAVPVSRRHSTELRAAIRL